MKSPSLKLGLPKIVEIFTIMHATRLLMASCFPLCVTLLDLQKWFDDVPHNTTLVYTARAFISIEIHVLLPRDRKDRFRSVKIHQNASDLYNFSSRKRPFGTPVHRQYTVGHSILSAMYTSLHRWCSSYIIPSYLYKDGKTASFNTVYDQI